MLFHPGRTRGTCRALSLPRSSLLTQPATWRRPVALTVLRAAPPCWSRRRWHRGIGYKLQASLRTTATTQNHNAHQQQHHHSTNSKRKSASTPPHIATTKIYTRIYTRTGKKNPSNARREKNPDQHSGSAKPGRPTKLHNYLSLVQASESTRPGVIPPQTRFFCLQTAL